MARSTQDIKSRMSKGAIFNSPARENKGLLTVMAISEFNNLSAKSAGNGFWNDPDIKDFKLNFAELGINKKGKTITDVYSGVKISSKKGVISLKMNPHACLFLKVE